MSVAARLRAAFALFALILAAVLTQHARTARGAVESGNALAAISARQRTVADDQMQRIGEMARAAAKYLVTRDRGYFDRLFQLASEYGEELRRIEALPLAGDERASMITLAREWRAVEDDLSRLADTLAATAAAALRTVQLVDSRLEAVRVATQALGDASQRAMTNELAASERVARAAERVSWAIAAGALALSLLLSLLLVRSIVRPLAALANGTRHIAAGRFTHRLDDSGRDEFAQVARDFNGMTGRLEELDRMKRDFVSNVSHDLKTPLSSMHETTALLLDELPGPLTEKQRHLLSLNQESCRRLSSMLVKLLDLSRLEVPSASVAVVDATCLVRGIVDRANAAASTSAPRVTLHEPDGRVFLRADADGIAQVVENLLENALKFSPPGGAVRVALADLPSRDVVMISVADEGPGVVDADKERVFERFYQTPAGKTARARGIGLGLAICRHIVEAHGGKIWVADHEPRGAVFCVLLPGPVSVTAESAA